MKTMKDSKQKEKDDLKTFLQSHDIVFPNCGNTTLQAPAQKKTLQASVTPPLSPVDSTHVAVLT